MASSQKPIELRDLQPGDLGWVLGAHGEQYWVEYGWDMGFERLVARVLGEFDPGPGERAWIATVGGERAGCVFLVRAPPSPSPPSAPPSAASAADSAADSAAADSAAAVPASESNTEGPAQQEGGMAKLRLLLVDQRYRGLGLASQLVDACLAFARESGYAGVELWTHANLAAARGMYARRGFALKSEEAYTGFGGHALVAESWEMRFPREQEEGRQPGERRDGPS